MSVPVLVACLVAALLSAPLSLFTAGVVVAASRSSVVAVTSTIVGVVVFIIAASCAVGLVMYVIELYPQWWNDDDSLLNLACWVAGGVSFGGLAFLGFCWE